MIKLLIGGSPCTNWSIAQRKNRETTASGIGWELFLNYVIAKEKFKPDFFLYENNKSAAPAIKEQISIELGVPLMHIDSALVSAQTRKRFYAFNWTVPQPEDRGILLRDILEDGIPDRDKAHCLKHQVGNVRDYFKKNHTQIAFIPVGVGFRNRRDEDGTLSRRFETHGQPKANALTTVQTDSMVAEPLNVTKDGKAQCLRATYYKDGIRNLVGNTVDRRTCVAEPIRVGGMPRPSGEVSQSQGLRIYSADGKAVSLKANAGGAGGKTGLYAIPDGSGPIRVANIGKGRQGERIYDASGKSCAVKQQGGGPGGHAQGLYATPCEELEGEMLVKIEPPIYWVEGGQIEIKGRRYPIKLPDGAYLIRKLTVTECCRLQTLPDDYCRAVSDSRAYAALGAGWTAEVIIHILQGALKDVPQDEEIVVLSMYDGIATGRYCLDQMGFTNIKYYAYEIDPYAIKVAKDNYPDIIECGDAFDLRKEDWRLPE